MKDLHAKGVLVQNSRKPARIIEKDIGTGTPTIVIEPQGRKDLSASHEPGPLFDTSESPKKMTHWLKDQMMLNDSVKTGRVLLLRSKHKTSLAGCGLCQSCGRKAHRRTD